MSRFPACPWLGLAVALAACAPATEPEAVEETARAELPLAEEPALPEECDAAGWRGLLGANIASTTLPADPLLRAFSTTDIVTRDFRPRRTNIVFDADGTVIRVFCG